MEPRNQDQHSEKPIRLLLVDDEKGFVDVLAKRLAKRNIRTTRAFSGSEGIQQLRRCDFDVAVLDLKLEDMDGIEILKIFKKMDPHMPVIMLTGHGSEKASKEGIRFGAFDYLTKPHELAELVDKIHEAVRHRESTDGTDETASGR
ncbi:response regulator [Desulfosarcina ovata]|uniref:Two-component system response regulator n=2 Tax=Desulfosarcina ovata TaxID=83564 RepID=A0A5K8A386_9BACT|nr:response regulator [Desulfosarcina ovata]BBO79597.1 two-component system response regulator [Desulfosarcina ovata subsp. sediminis]BBO87005.1 two-component system response regulator [Desulfosarcina ovata subsp. ovata]